MTDRMQPMGETLHAAEAERYRLLVELAQDQIYVIGRDDRVEYVNKAAAERLGHPPDRVIGQPRSSFFPPQVAEQQKASLDRVFESAEPHYVESPAFYRGKQVWLGTWLTPLIDDGGTVTAVLGASRDITERHRLEEQLSKAQTLETLGRLAGGIAHDFNNHLTAILGYVKMLLSQIGEDKPMTRDLREVERAAERAAELVKRLLAFGRREVVQIRRISLNETVTGLRPMLERLIGEHIEVRFDLLPELFAIDGDAGQIEQVLMNLALNARDAMPHGGTLRVETRNASVEDANAPMPAMPAGDYVVLAVSDDGAGMDDHTQAHLFEPFFTTKPMSEGTGLGLATVYGIVKQAEGFIFVESAVGQGTTFTLYWPATGAESTVEAKEAPAPARPAPVGRETILLVEDDDNVRRFARLALERHGFHVVEAGSPDEAMAKVGTMSDEPIHLLLTDVVMPGRSGPELAVDFGHARPGVPVLYMSGYPADLVTQGGQVEGTARLLMKPFTSADLLANIETMLGRRDDDGRNQTA